jgi:hypothetical protein
MVATVYSTIRFGTAPDLLILIARRPIAEPVRLRFVSAVVSVSQ